MKKRIEELKPKINKNVSCTTISATFSGPVHVEKCVDSQDLSDDDSVLKFLYFKPPCSLVVFPLKGMSGMQVATCRFPKY